MSRAGECGGEGGRRGRSAAAHAGAGAVAGFLGCLLLVWAIGGCGRRWWGCGEAAAASDGVEEVAAQFNLSVGKLQALASLLSSPERECICKSGTINDGNPVNSMLDISNSRIKNKLPGGNQNWLDDVILQDCFTNEDNYDKSSHETNLLQNAVQQDIGSPTTPWNKNVLSCNHGMIFSLSASFGIVVSLVVITISKKGKQENELCQHEKLLQTPSAKISRKWSKRALLIGVLVGLCSSVWIFSSMYADVVARRIENLENMCDERARMLQDQFNVSMNHVRALAILVSTFHHGKNPSAIDQKTFEDFTARTTFERPLMSGVAYALKVLHSERELFEQKHGWKIKKMEAEDQSLVHDYNPDKLEPSPVQDEYAPVIFSQETVKHIISVDMMSGKEDRDNILRSRATGKGALTSPFELLKSNHLGVVLTFTVYKYDLHPNATPEERIEATLGYLGASFDVPSLVERLLEQLASKQKIVVRLYDITNHTSPTKMYDSDVNASGDLHISSIDFGDPTRKHEMHCRFKHKPSLPWSAIMISSAVAIIVLLVGYIIYATLNSLEEAENNYTAMRELKGRAEAADVAKSQFLATVSHEIRTPMNGVLGMLQMLMDTELDTTQRDFVVTAQESGKSLINLINEVLDLAKIESGKIELEAVRFDVRDILDNVVSLFSEKSWAKGVELAVLVSDQVPDVLIGDPWRFRQIITNLVGNSMKFTEQGHIFIQVHLVEEVKKKMEVLDDTSPENREVTDNSNNTMAYNTLSGLEAANKWKTLENFRMFKDSSDAIDSVNLLVTVEDTGVGITKDAQTRIFTPFMQADGSTSRTYGGTGIGLSITKRLVELMGGEIGFVSKPGVSSTFSFTAIFKENRKDPGDIKRYCPEPTPPDFQGMRALVVDGRHVRAEVTMYHLRRLGIQCDLAATSESALSVLLEACNSSVKSSVNMVLVDKEAWGKDSGLAFFRCLVDLWLKGTLKSWQTMPKFFLLAGSISPADSDCLRLAGYANSIRKPLRLSTVAACLSKALGVGLTGRRSRDNSLVLRSVLTGKHILVVDDNAVNRIVAAGALKKYGAIVTCVDSGKEAISMLEPPHKFDACFMDVQMPEMDGFEATRLIRAVESKINNMIHRGEVSSELYGNKAHWHVPILAMTADVIQATFEGCMECGMDGYVAKPFEEQQLYSAVAHFLEADATDPLS
ncbi:probable histidine kinase 5 isoform X2 [Oryza brachyantha]|uniref:probable histidine kinase 5 isoform X2 n=1 Tax=Oryza brachyantha TaxID=4533 RepID=UPI001ADA797A|nr:probable histidine kinase 5 isoform X2 [Oryza brachyantha]